MTRMIRADLSRLYRSKGYYIIIILSLVLLAIFALAAYFVTGFAREMTGMDAGSFMNGDLLEQARRMMNLNFFASFYLSHNSILHLLIAVFAAGFISKDHQTGYLKNLMAVPGVRHKWVTSKLLVMGFAAALFYLIFLLGSAFTVVLFGNRVEVMAGELLRYFGLHLLVDMAIFALICLIVSLTQARTAALVLALLISLNIQSILYLLIDSLGILPFKLREWGMMGQASKLPLKGGIVSLMGGMDGDVFKITQHMELFYVALGLFVVATGLSLWFIRKVDYKA